MSNVRPMVWVILKLSFKFLCFCVKMDPESQTVAVVFAGLVSLTSAICLGIRLSRCTVVECPCCKLEREVIPQENITSSV